MERYVNELTYTLPKERHIQRLGLRSTQQNLLKQIHNKISLAEYKRCKNNRDTNKQTQDNEKTNRIYETIQHFGTTILMHSFVFKNSFRHWVIKIGEVIKCERKDQLNEIFKTSRKLDRNDVWKLLNINKNERYYRK